MEKIYNNMSDMKLLNEAVKVVEANPQLSVNDVTRYFTDRVSGYNHDHVSRLIWNAGLKALDGKRGDETDQVLDQAHHQALIKAYKQALQDEIEFQLNTNLIFKCVYEETGELI